MRLYQAGKYAEAATIVRRLLANYERTLGPEHPRVGTLLNNLAELYRMQGRYAEAEPLFKRSLPIRERTMGREHPEVGATLNNLGLLYHARGRYADAEPLFQRSLAIREKALGRDHTDVAQSLSNLALVYYIHGRYAEVEALIKRSLAIWEKALGSDHASVGLALNNLAELYRALGRYAEAEPLFKRSLAIREKALGRDHPDVGHTLNELALLNDAQGRPASAELLFKRSLVIREKALGLDHPAVATSLNALALSHSAQGRYAEAEPLFKRSLAIWQKAVGADHATVGVLLSNLADVYRMQGRYPEAEPLYKRSLVIREKALGSEHADVGQALNQLALLYLAQGRIADTEPLLKRSLAIREKTLGPEHPDVGTSFNNLAYVAGAQGRLAEAEALYKRSLVILEKTLGPDHLSVNQTIDNLAGLGYTQGNWASAAENWRRSTGIIKRRAERGLAGNGRGDGLEGEARRLAWQFWGLVSATHRLVPQGRRPTAAVTAEMFEAAQWAQGSEAAASLAQMAARSAKGSPQLAELVREQQDLMGEWQGKDKGLFAAKSEPPAKRKAEAERVLAERLAAIAARLAEIDRQLARDFPEYAALASPASLSIAEVQTQLGANEALVFFLHTDERSKPLPGETFTWVVTKSAVRWVRSELGTAALAREVAALRCGLDAAAWHGGGLETCTKAVGIALANAPGSNQQLPFDYTRAHRLYSALFGEVQDLVKGKNLLIVPSGPLTQLPFQVLVSDLAADTQSSSKTREIARIGAELNNLSTDLRQQAGAHGRDGVRVIRLVPGGPAELAGFKPADILLSVGGARVGSFEQAINTIQTHAPRTIVQFRLWRENKEISVEVTLGAETIQEWVPRFLNSATDRKVSWLARQHAVTILPAISSLKALRRVGRPSAAPKPMIGFGNPLLEGPDVSHAARAKLAREKQRCPETRLQRLAALAHSQLGVSRVETRGSLADLSHLRRQVPLPETADELCAVAQDVNAEARDIHLGAQAAEREVKRLSASGELAKYRMVHFATHGVLAGQLDGTHEPGLILTPPARPSEEDDGYLSASEIAGLKLDADWVILSACNTAAGAATNAEALSGLARAFIYAQARALLVSHWAVSSDATVKLVTTAVREMSRDAKVGRAEALRRSMLALIDTGAALEAHPASWAPFVVVGEGGR